LTGNTCLEATAQDDVLEVLEILLHELFGDAEKADKKARLLEKPTSATPSDARNRFPNGPVTVELSIRGAEQQPAFGGR